MVGAAQGAGHCTRSRALHLAHEGLDEMADGHAGGDGVGVDDEVWHDALGRPGHVLLRVSHANRPLLAVPARKLVPHLRHADRPHLRTRCHPSDMIRLGQKRRKVLKTQDWPLCQHGSNTSTHINKSSMREHHPRRRAERQAFFSGRQYGLPCQHVRSLLCSACSLGQ